MNTYRAVSFMSPFGGYKCSGLGRGNGKEAIYEYLEQKSVSMDQHRDRCADSVRAALTGPVGGPVSGRTSAML